MIIELTLIIFSNDFKLHDSVGIINDVDKALIMDNGYSLVEINNTVYIVYKPTQRGLLSKFCSSLYLFCKGITINKKMRLDHQLLRNPEPAL